MNALFAIKFIIKCNWTSFCYMFVLEPAVYSLSTDTDKTVKADEIVVIL